MRGLFAATISVCTLGYRCDTWQIKFVQDDKDPRGGKWGKGGRCSPTLRCGATSAEEIGVIFGGKGPPPFRAYNPFEQEPSLFLVFADLNPTFDEVVGFANKYGCIASEWAAWKPEILTMRASVELWQAILAKDERTLTRHVVWEREPPLGPEFVSPLQDLVEPVDAEDGPALPPKNFGKIGSWQWGDVIGPATHLLDKVFECKIRWNRAQMVTRRKNGQLTFQVELRELLDVLWIQFASAVSASQAYRRCKLCNRPFELSPDVNRADRMYCSDTCRVKHYQRRQAKARKLRQEGRNLREIAVEVDSNVKTIKRWLGEG